MADHTDYDKDPGALAWARGKIEATAKRYEAFADRADAEGRDKQAAEWRAMATAVRHDLIGGEGTVIASFDERLPALEEHSGAAPAAATADRVAAFLDDVQMQAEDHHLVPEGMVLPLVAAVRRVLELAAEFDVPPYFLDDQTATARNVALRFRRAITGELSADNDNTMEAPDGMG